MIAGLRAAAAASFSHALQLDADGQHQVEDTLACWQRPNAIRTA
ncbi:hypothetical protein E05_37500 [Plautia stali symbiont]|nr:hypothetical protein E05_37500 [Plautia stali symbiont]